MVEERQYLKKWKTPLENCNQISMGLLKDDGDLTINLCDVSTEIDQRYEIVFEDFDAYRSTNECYLLNLWKLRSDDIGFTFIVEKSDWIKELMKDPIFQDHYEGVVHYVIATLDEGVEILAKQPPQINKISD